MLTQWNWKYKSTDIWWEESVKQSTRLLLLHKQQSLQPIHSAIWTYFKIILTNICVAHDVVTKTCLWQYDILTCQSGVKMTVQVDIDIAAKQRELVVVSASKNIKIFYHNIEIHFIALHCPMSALRFDQQPALTCTLTSLWLYLTLLWRPAAPCSGLVSAPIGCGRGRGGSLAVAASHSAPRPRSLAPAASWAADRDSRTGDPVVRH